MASLDVGVIGCGTAGGAAALLLARAGHRVTIYERVPDPGPVGAGIMLQPTGQLVLARLGLLAPILERGARIERLWCRQASGRTLVDLHYARVDPKYFGIGLHRGLLFETLYQACKVEPGVTVRCGLGIQGLADGDAGRRYVVCNDGARHGPHDLIIVADGSVSELHDDLALPMTVRPYAWGALWFVARDPHQAYRGALFQVVRGTSRMFGLMPRARPAR